MIGDRKGRSIYSAGKQATQPHERANTLHTWIMSGDEIG